MNVLSRKVLKEVRFGLLITELDVRGSGVKRGGCLRTKRVSRQSRLTFRCHDATNVNKRERDRERETRKKAPNIININEYR